MRAATLVLVSGDGGLIGVSVDVAGEGEDRCSGSFADLGLGLLMLSRGVLLG